MATTYCQKYLLSKLFFINSISATIKMPYTKILKKNNLSKINYYIKIINKIFGGDIG